MATAKKPAHYVEPFTNTLGLPQFRLRAANHLVVMESNTFTTVENRDRAMGKVAESLKVPINDGT